MLFLWLTATIKIYAQDTLSYQKKGYSTYFQELIKSNAKTPVNYYFIPIKNYTSATLTIKNTNNQIKQKQQPKSIFDIFLGAEGLYTTKKSIFTGKMSYTKNFQYQLGWNSTQMLPQTEVEKSPFYYFSYKEGSWKNQFYKLQGTFTNQLINKKLYASLAIDYNALQYYRINDPKPELTYLDLLSTISVHYLINKKHLLGTSFSYGYMNNEVDIDYTGSASDINIPFNVDLYNRFSLGYGLITSARYLRAEEALKKKEIGFHYLYNGTKNKWSSTIKYKHHKNTFYDNYIRRFPRGSYKVRSVLGKIRWDNLIAKKFAQINANYQKGTNFRIVTKGKNYEASSLLITATYGLLKPKSEFSAFANYNCLTKKDYTSLNKINFSLITLGVNYGKDFTINKNSKFWILSKLGYQFKLNGSYNFNNSSTSFVKEIALPSWYYNTNSKIILDVKLAYQTHFLKTKANLGIFANSNYLYKMPNTVKTNLNTSNGVNNNAGFFVNIIY